MAGLKLDRPVHIQAFISPTVPETYVQTRLNLLAMLRELEARGSGKVHLQINDTERFSEEAERAEHAFGISPRRVETVEHGARGADTIFLGVAMTCGRQKVVMPFIDRGIPVEYELVRSIGDRCPAEAQAGGRAHHRRPAFRQIQLAEHVGRAELADHRRVAEAV